MKRCRYCVEFLFKGVFMFYHASARFTLLDSRSVIHFLYKYLDSWNYFKEVDFHTRC